MKRTAPLFALCVAILTTLAAGRLLADEATAKQELSPEIDYQAERSGAVTYEVDLSIVVTPPYHGKTMKVWLPLPPSNAGQEISERRLNTFPMKVEPTVSKEPVYGNEFAYFEFDHPEGAQIIRHRFRAKVWQLNWKADLAKAETVKQWPQSFDAYLQPQADVAADDDYRATIAKLAPGEGSADSLLASMKWIDENMTYDHVNASLRADALFAFAGRRGHCSDYHGLCATMGRSLGYPTRVVYGMNLFPKNSPSHCKLEAFLPPHGWINFDLSETQKMIAAIGKDEKLSTQDKQSLAAAARRRLQSGFRDNTWLQLARGTNYDLSPPAAQKVRVVRTAYVEADGKAYPDPDPANVEQRAFSWMTVVDIQSDAKVSYPFKDFNSLKR